jgi:hypothetical protein
VNLVALLHGFGDWLPVFVGSPGGVQWARLGLAALVLVVAVGYREWARRPSMPGPDLEV